MKKPILIFLKDIVGAVQAPTMPLLLGLLIVLGVEGISQDLNGRIGYSQSVIHEGIQVKFTMLHIDPEKDSRVFTQNDDVLFRFEISDTLSKSAVTGAAPAAWMEPMADAEDQDAECGKKITSFLSGSIFNRAELDLNVFYVLVMNDDASITVVDPLFSFGGSQLLAYVQLDGIPKDWALSKDQLTLYVTLPEEEMVSVVSTSDWSVKKNIPINAPVDELVMQADNALLWVDFSSKRIEGFSGVAAISTHDGSIKASIPTGGGEHHVVVSADSRYVFVSNSRDKNISVIDVNTFTKIKDIPMEGEIAGMAYSSMADVLYVIDESQGIIHCIDANSHNMLPDIVSMSSMSSIQFDPDGRYAIILSEKESKIQVLDASVNRIVQTGTTEKSPIEVTFSDELVYVLHEGSDLIMMFPLEVIGKEGVQLQAADFPGGQFPPGQVERPSNGNLMVQAPGANAMLIANNMDKTIYYYMEGMAAPMGNFANYNKKPRAVEVVDRSIEERRPGVYETVGKIRGYGDYDIPFFVDVPRIMHCFSVPVRADEAQVQNELKEKLGALSVHHSKTSRVVKSGEPFNMMFVLFDPIKDEAVTGLQDVRIRGVSSSNWFHEGEAEETQVAGVYQYNTVFDEAGVYYMYVGSRSRELPFNNPQYLVVKVVDDTVEMKN